MNTQNVNNDSLAVSIFRIHASRIGFVRVAIGGGLMYTTIPLFIFLHTTVTLFLYKCLMRPLLGLTHLRTRDYVVLDRYNLAGLHWFDRLNCLFCEYANGVTHLMGHEIDQVATTIPKSNVFTTLVVSIYLVPQTLFLIVGMLAATIPSNMLMKLLGLHRGSHKRIAKRLRVEQYASQYPSIFRHTIRLYKISAEVLVYNLEQIESAWCPIKHLEKDGHALPLHHERFFSRTELDLMQQTLNEKGTVSNRPLKF